jgi:hypothetical protein
MYGVAGRQGGRAADNGVKDLSDCTHAIPAVTASL